MICPACGAKNNGSDRSCRQCRATLPGAGGGAMAAQGTGSRPILGGRFNVIRSLGKGGMSEIVLAKDVKLGRLVAVKCFSSSSLSDIDSKARFRREGQAASRLEHPNLCTVYEIAEENDRGYIVMQYVDGVTLDQMLKLKPLSIGQVVGIAAQVADGMAAAQEQGIVHRDIKPGNIMIDRSSQVKVLDFGLANVGAVPEGEDGSSERRARARAEKGTVLGTAAYMSPEQARGLKLDGRSDIFSFGVMLYEMLEHHNPFCDDEDIVTMYNILHREVQFNRPAPEALRSIVRRCLQKDRHCRYRDFEDVKKALRALAEEEAVQFQGGMAKRPDR